MRGVGDGEIKSSYTDGVLNRLLNFPTVQRLALLWVCYLLVKTCGNSRNTALEAYRTNERLGGGRGRRRWRCEGGPSAMWWSIIIIIIIIIILYYYNYDNYYYNNNFPERKNCRFSTIFFELTKNIKNRHSTTSRCRVEIVFSFSSSSPTHQMRRAVAGALLRWRAEGRARRAAGR